MYEQVCQNGGAEIRGAGSKHPRYGAVNYVLMYHRHYNLDEKVYPIIRITYLSAQN